MSDFEHQLQDELRAAADGVRSRHTEVGLILSAGAQRAKRRQARLAIGGVLLAGVAVVGGVAVLTRDTGTDVSIASEPDSTELSQTDRSPEASSVPVASGDGSAVVVPSALTWRSVDVDSSEALGVYSAWGAGLQNGGLYEVSTEPGRSNNWQPTVWRSDDGVSWQAGSSVPLMPRSLASSDGSIYAVGTAPSEGRVAKAAGGDAAVAVSSDGGTSWDTIHLPLDLVAIEDAPGVSSVMVNTWVADGPAGVMVLVQPMAMPDLSGVPGYSPEYGWVNHDDGIGVYGLASGADAQPCDALVPTTMSSAPSTEESSDTTAVAPSGECGFTTTETSRLTWAELGADAETVAYLQSRKFFAYAVGTDGTVTEAGTFTVDEFTGQFSANTFVSTDSAYALVATNYAEDGTMATLSITSPDGVTWTRNDLVSTSYLTGPARWSDGLVGAVQSYGDDGIAVDTQVALSPDGASWSAVDLDPVLDEVPLEGGNRWIAGITGGDSGISVLVGFQQISPTGSSSEASTADTAPVGTAPGDPVAETTAVFIEQTVSFAVLHSTDGVHWSYDVPDELREPTGGVGIRQAGAQVVVSIQQPASGGGLPGQVALIATPNG